MRNRIGGFLILALCVAPPSLRAQEARLAGSVTDPSGAVLVGVFHHREPNRTESRIHGSIR